MSYFRVYPNKNNTLFKNFSGEKILTDGNVNTGLNPILELRDGNSESVIVFQFNLKSIKPLLQSHSYTCNFKLWDAGRQDNSLLKDLKPINVCYFKEDFVEGDGWSFVANKAVEGVSNWNKRDTNNIWNGVLDNTIDTYQIQHIGDDILISNIQSSIQDALDNNVNPNFGLKLETTTVSSTIYAKYIYSRHTRTIYKPYLEFYVDDSLQDERSNIYATIPQKLHLLNLSGNDFSDTVT